MSIFNLKFYKLINSGKVDKQGREIGYAVDIYEHSENLGVYRAKVQKTRNGSNFGPSRSPETFYNLEEAKAWAFKNAKAKAGI